jgi:DNA-binding SARP family transcriptional activator
VRVLAPVLEAEVAGEPVRLRDMAAKLLLLLLLTHPEPLHVERAVDVLWPDASADEGRPRLNTVVHRLRSQLRLSDDGLRRVGDLLVLDPTGWDVDLLRFRARPSDVSAQLAITGNLCHVQFPYDDFLIEERRSLAAEAARAIEATARTADRATSEELQRVTLKLMS